jgi:hypothetical protein
MARIWLLVGARDFSLLFSLQTSPGAHPASYLMGTGASLPRSKAAGAWSWPLTSILCQGHEWWCYTSTCPYEVVSESSQTVIVVPAHWKKMREEATVTLLKTYCISLPCHTALSTCTVFMRVLSDFMFRFLCDKWQNRATCLHQVLREAW